MKYECHITIDPEDKPSRLHQLGMYCDFYKFKVASLLKETGKPNDLDQFMTGHDISFEGLKWRMNSLCQTLKDNGFVLRRYKIEEILLDSRLGDSEGLL